MRWIGLSFAAAFDRWVAHAKGKGRQPAHTRSLKAAFGYLTGKNGKVSPQRLAEVLRGVMAQVAIPCRGDEDAAILAVQRAVEGMIMDQHLNTIHEPHAVFDDLVKSVDHGPSPHQEFDDLVAAVSHGPAANAPRSPTGIQSDVNPLAVRQSNRAEMSPASSDDGIPTVMPMDMPAANHVDMFDDLVASVDHGTNSRSGTGTGTGADTGAGTGTGTGSGADTGADPGLEHASSIEQFDDLVASMDHHTIDLRATAEMAPMESVAPPEHDLAQPHEPHEFHQHHEGDHLRAATAGLSFIHDLRATTEMHHMDTVRPEDHALAQPHEAHEFHQHHETQMHREFDDLVGSITHEQNAVVSEGLERALQVILAQNDDVPWAVFEKLSPWLDAAALLSLLHAMWARDGVYDEALPPNAPADGLAVERLRQLVAQASKQHPELRGNHEVVISP